MSIRKDIYASVVLSCIVTLFYYFAYAFVDLYVSKLCHKYVCFEFPSYAEIMSIWIALIGLYFVIKSLEAWKNQHKYQTAKLNMQEIYKIAEDLENFNSNLQDLEKFEKSLPLPPLYNNKICMFDSYQKYVEHSKVHVLVKGIQFNIEKKEPSLYQKDFEALILKALDYLNSIDEKIINHNEIMLQKKLEEQELYNASLENLTEGYRNFVKKMNEDFELNKSKSYLTQEMIINILNQEEQSYKSFIAELHKLQTRLNNYIE